MAIEWEILSNTIRDARMKKGLTQEELAERLDITIGHLQHMEGGRRKPSVQILFRLMEELDFSVDALVFPDRAETTVIHTDGLTQRQAEALERLADAIKNP